MKTYKHRGYDQPSDDELLDYGLDSLASLIAELEYDRQLNYYEYSVTEYLQARQYGRSE